jgi:hypothetical protein
MSLANAASICQPRPSSYWSGLCCGRGHSKEEPFRFRNTSVCSRDISTPVLRGDQRVAVRSLSTATAETETGKEHSCAVTILLNGTCLGLPHPAAGHGRSARAARRRGQRGRRCGVEALRLGERGVAGNADEVLLVLEGPVVDVGQGLGSEVSEECSGGESGGLHDPGGGFGFDENAVFMGIPRISVA